MLFSPKVLTTGVLICYLCRTLRQKAARRLYLSLRARHIGTSNRATLIHYYTINGYIAGQCDYAHDTGSVHKAKLTIV